MMPLHKTISDWTECPLCVAENDKLGSGDGFADWYFNHDNCLWAVCSGHNVRWFVTRELLCTAADHPPAPELPIVETDYGRTITHPARRHD
jgi:hypothetical protein